MKKTAILLVIVMMLSLLPQGVFAAVVDDSTDGILEWQGYKWQALCLPDGTDSSMIYNTQPCPHGWMYVDDSGYMNFQLVSEEDKSGTVHRIEIPKRTEYGGVDVKDNFDVEFQMQVFDYGESLGYQLFPPDTRVYFVFEESGITYQTDTGYYTLNTAIGYDLHTWKTEVREGHCRLFMDGQELLSFNLPDLSNDDQSRNGSLRFYGTPYVKVAPKMQLRSLSITTYNNIIKMSPKNGEKLAFGEDIVLKAEVSDSPEYVDYYVGDVIVGTATAETDYAYTLRNVKMGSYNLRAISSDGQYTSQRIVTVVDPKTSTVNCASDVAYGENAVLSLDYPSNLDIVYAEYYKNGQLAGVSDASPFEVTLSDLKMETSTVFAKVYLADGSFFTTDEENITVNTTDVSGVTLGSEYEISYSYNGGAGTITSSDGYFGLDVTHSGENVTIKTKEDTETLNLASGNYRIVVNSGIAEIYFKGQLVNSVFLPRSDENGISYSGVSDFKVYSNGTKAIRFYKETENSGSFTDENLNMDLYYSIEFDKTNTSDEALLLYDGEYELSLKLNGKISALTQPVTEGEMQEKILSENTETGYYRITVYRGIAQLFIDNDFVASFRLPKVAHKPSLRRTVSDASSSTFIAVKNTDDVYYMSEDFQGGKPKDWSEFWYKIYGDVAATLDEGKMSLSGNGTYLFDATAENPEISLNVAFGLTEQENSTGESSGNDCDGGGNTPTTTVTKSGDLAFNVRYRNENENIRVMYSHSEGKWSLVETVNGVSTVLRTVNNTMNKTSQYNYYLTVKDDKLTFRCEDNYLFTEIPLSLKGNGKFGLSVADCEYVKVDDFNYKGNGKPNTGVNYSWWSSDEFHGTLEFIKGDEENSVYAYAYPAHYSSTADGGETWSEVADYTGVNNMIYLESGKKLTVSDWSSQSHAKLYEADGTPIAENVVIQSANDKVADRNAMAGRLMQAKKTWGTGENAQPRVFYVTSEGSEINGKTRVYYSDDEGLTWSETSTVMDFKNLGNFYCGEADIVDMPDDSIRVYVRTDKGFLYYLESKDGGKTFDTVPKASRFIAPSTAFSIERDREADATYYIIWEYDVTTASLMYIQMPRNRAAMAVSRDGMETWEYIMEMDDLGKNRTAKHMNASLRVINGYVFANHSYDAEYSYAEDMKVRNMVYVLDPAKLTTVKRFADAHIVIPDFTTVYDEVPSQAVLPKVSGTAMIYGNSMPVSMNGKMADVSAVALAMGAELSKTDSGVTLTIGDGTVSFARNSENYIVNGVTNKGERNCLSEDGKYLDIEVCAKIFGKTFIETDKSYLVLTTVLSEKYQNELGNLVEGLSGEMKLCVDAFKNIGNAADLKQFFADYKVLLNLPNNIGEKSFENMYSEYCKIDLSQISDINDVKAAVDGLVKAETDRVNEFLAAINAASESGDWQEIMTCLTDTYAELLSFTVDVSEVKNPEQVFKKMLGITYTGVAQVEETLKAALEAQKAFESGRNNSLTISTVSREFEGWVEASDESACGVGETVIDGENIAVISAYEKLTNGKKTTMENMAPSGVVYVDPADFEDKSGSFKVSGTEPSKSNTMVTVFEMTKPTADVSATFATGTSKATVKFTAEGTNVGNISKRLRDKDVLTYRVELSLNQLSVYAKAPDEEDSAYEFVGTMTTTATTKTNYSVEFVADDTVTVSNLGIYSHLPSVKYDISAFVPLDTIQYSATGTNGNGMADLAASAAGGTGIVADSETGELVLTAKNGGSNRYLRFGPYYKNMTDGFDRAVIDMTVSVGDGGDIYIYYCDNSNFRYAQYFNLISFNGVSSQTGMNWADGKYYNLRMITNVLGYDADGQGRTYASLYAKPVDSQHWVCVVQDIPMTKGSKSTEDQILIGNLNNADIRISDLSIKTYKLNEGSCKYANQTVDMPTMDYVFSFDYMRMDADTPTVFTVGGEDYGQTFSIEPYHVVTDVTDYVKVDATFEEDKWYRIFGTVKMTAESVHQNDKTKILKNTLTMYVTDENGNTVTLFENLPMLKTAGCNGVSFGMENTDYAGVKLKNIRVYNGKVLDGFVTESDGKATVNVDFLNDDTVMSDDAVVILGAYVDERMLFTESLDLTEDVEALGVKRFSFENIDYSNQTFRAFMWKKAELYAPLTTITEVN